LSGELVSKEQELSKVQAAVRRQLPAEGREEFESALQAWQRYTELECNSVASRFAGGTVLPVAVLRCRIEMVDTRRRLLQTVYDVAAEDR
jgi:uncharacterized protein YecT (DUF1311 family)